MKENAHKRSKNLSKRYKLNRRSALGKVESEEVIERYMEVTDGELRKNYKKENVTSSLNDPCER
jgi:hypothetical protein